jgi:NADH-quinone oxidoreductase subunit N
VTLFIATVPKLAAIGMAFRLLPMGLGPLQEHWQDMLAVLAAASLVLGNLAAIAQRNLKRMLAYSTISHVGFILMGLVSGLVTGYAAAMFYVIVYALMTTAAFGIILALAQGEQRFEEIRDFRGLNQRKPWFALLMLLVIASLAGFPPLVGFFAKLLVLKAAMDGGYLWLAILGGVSAVVGAFYYLRVLKAMYFDEPESEAELKVLPEVGMVLSVNALALLGLGFAFNPLLERCLAVWQ